MAGQELFRFSTFLDRRTTLIMDHELVVLEHQFFNNDRIRRIPFDQVEYVLYWKRLAGGQLTVFSLLFLGCFIGGIATLAHRAAGGVPSLVFGTILLVCAVGMLVLIGITLYKGRQHLLIVRAGIKVHLRGSMGPAKFQRLVTQIATQTREVQSALAAPAATNADADAASPTQSADAPLQTTDSPAAEPTQVPS